eukprot:TRINITY_DN1789_c0_g1_i1.p1 TRINITY_DN1789_c0_g1~~TRINITY_DN1789_c0_g1_i1.p1  ORF type:complete len:389 (+),score=79.19 TRINITY_DN1789_c0_g1_i1:42-1169(+)
MKIKVSVNYFRVFDVEVLPTDSVWCVKWKIYHNEDIQIYCEEQKDSFSLPSPDDMILRIRGGERMDNCEMSLMSYSIHEGSQIVCSLRSFPDEVDYIRYLNVFRKKRITLPLWRVTNPIWGINDGFIHIHELRCVDPIEPRKSGHVAMADLTRNVCRMIRTIPSLMKLNLSENHEMKDKGIIQIAAALRVNTSLKELMIGYCGIGSKGAESLGTYLERNTSLQILDLSGNDNISVEGWSVIARGLEINKSLKILKLDKCGIGPESAAKIGEMFARNKALLKIQLIDNVDIGDEGAIQIAKGLERNSSLRNLNMRNCGIRSEGAARIGVMLMKNDYLMHLDISRHGRIDDGAVILIAEGLMKNCALQELILHRWIH